MNASQLSDEAGDIVIRVTSRTTEQAKALVCEFWQELGYSPAVELDSAEAMLR